MKKTVYKYKLDSFDCVLEVPKGLTPLRVDQQYGNIILWALVDPEAPLISRRFKVIGTGKPITITGHEKFLGTVFQGHLVWHVFDLGEVDRYYESRTER